MEKVLITGATGFLGKYVVEEFLKNNYQVTAVGRNVEAGRKLKKLGAKFISVDLRNKEAVKSVTKHVDYVIHAAAMSTVWGKYKDFYSNNVTTTKNVIDACIENKVKRFIFVSSPSIYSSKYDRLDIYENEYNRKNNLNNYIKTKIMAEDCVREGQTKGLYSVIIRPRGIFGIGDTSIIPRLIQTNNKVGIPLFNNGRNLVDITYVENVAYALRLACQAEDVNGDVFNITNGEPTEFKNILDKTFEKINIVPKYRNMNFKRIYFVASMLEGIYKLFGIYKKEPILTKYTVCTLGASQTLNIDKARKKLKYTPKVSLDEGIEIYANWYRKNNRIR